MEFAALDPKIAALIEPIVLDGCLGLEHRTFETDPMAYLMNIRNRIIMKTGHPDLRDSDILVVWPEAGLKHLVCYLVGKTMEERPFKNAGLRAYGLRHVWSADQKENEAWFYNLSQIVWSPIAKIINLGV